MAAKVNNDLCTGCGICLDVCPMEAIQMKNDKAFVSEDCSECGVCVDECPNGALSL
jgi:Fe-S-cluster-containing hydrogenase component 2